MPLCPDGTPPAVYLIRWRVLQTARHNQRQLDTGATTVTDTLDAE